MPRLLQIFAAAAALSGVVTNIYAAPFVCGSDDDTKETVENRLLKILRDRGVLKDSEYDELLKLGAAMRAEDTITSSAIEREIAELAAKVERQQGGEAKKTTPDTKVAYKLGNGITVSQGDDFSMSIFGREQIRFSHIAADGRTSAGQEDRDSFDVRRARLFAKGYVLSKLLSYQIQFELAAAASPLRDAYLNYEFEKWMQLRAGQMKRPFSRQNWTSAGDLQFPDRVSVVERFRSIAGDRDVGAMLWGTFEENSIFEWYFGLFNGDGSNSGTPNAVNLGPASTGLNAANASNNDSSGLETVARIVYNPFGQPSYSEGDLDLTDTPKVAFGLQYDFNPEHRGNPLGLTGIPGTHLPSYDVHTFGGDFTFKYQGLFFTTEAFHREINPTDRLNDLPAFRVSTEDGWFVQTGYFTGQEKGKGAEVALRYGQIDYDQNIFPATGLGGTTKTDDLTAAFNYYFAGHNVKLQIAYTYRTNNLRRIDANDEHQVFQVQAQVKF